MAYFVLPPENGRKALVFASGVVPNIAHNFSHVTYLPIYRRRPIFVHTRQAFVKRISETTYAFKKVIMKFKGEFKKKTPYYTERSI